MNSYFDQLQREIAAAVSDGRHLPWYRRVRYTGRARALIVVVAALVVATPAVGAVTNWFGFGKPFYFTKGSPTLGSGSALAHTSRLLPIRIADPQGGPAWGLRLVYTTRRDVCLVFGRVEDHQLGSLGIDGAWSDDRLFHPFPKGFTGGWGLECGTTDGAGHAFFNVQFSGIAASANPFNATRGPDTGGCRTPRYMPSRLQRLPRGRAAPGSRTSPGTCPAGASRMVFTGLLGPDATSITYRAPDGRLQTRRTSGDDGAYLLVFPLNQKTCNLYFQGPNGARGPCGGSVGGGGGNGGSPDPIGPIKAIHYRGGRTCRLGAPAALLAGYTAVIRRLLPSSSRGRSLVRPAVRARIERALARFATAQHLTRIQLDDAISGLCPAVGYVDPNQKHLTEAQVASRITVGRIRHGATDTGAAISFTARQPVKNDDSWYEVATTGPAHCEADGNGPVGYGNVRVGQKLSEQIGVSASCRGTVRGVVGYVQNGGPTDAETAGSGGTPGKDGSIIVGRFKFTIH
ncbi:MAG TPA: hypothetical protein VHW23_36740 [Kofleriaceae bacterium]|jgi:hypothetical protein|nr:hypothetical protein [Kofleriaceae bacterium]